MTPEMIERLKKQAAKSAGYIDDEDFLVDDYAGGNVDDAYSLGSEHGETQLARDILTEIGETW